MTPRQAPPFFQFTTLLAGALFRLRFRWNTRFRYWTVDCFDGSSNAVYLGRKLVIGEALFEGTVQPGLPLAQVFSADPAGVVERIERTDLGQTAQLYAVPSSAV